MGKFDFAFSDDWVEYEGQAAVKQARHDLKQLGLNLCQDCGNEISKTRMRILPSATRCIGCRQRHERSCRHGLHFHLTDPCDNAEA